MAHELRPMGVGDILDATFKLYRSRFVPLLTITMVVYVPYAILIAGIQSAFFPEVAEEAERLRQLQDPETLKRIYQGAIGTMVVVAVWMFTVYPLCVGATIHQVSTAYLGEEISGVESYRRATPRMGSLILSWLVAGILITIGLFLCVVPGVILYAFFILVPAVVMIENARGIASLRRSRELVAGNLGKAFALLALLFLLGIVFGIILQAILALVSPPQYVSAFLSNVGQGLVMPVGFTAAVLLYYDLRIRKEAFDLERLAADLGTSSET